MATFILVHGTFTRAAHWPALRDGLALAASAVGEHSRFEELRWSGKNRASARQGAAAEIFSVVQKSRSTSSNEKIFIIGHSHGGSAIAYFLKEYPSLAKMVSGCAFLSTPFVAIRPRAQRNVFLLVSLLVIYAFGASFGYIYNRWLGGDFLENPTLYLLSGYGLGAAFLGFVYLTDRKFRNSDKLLEEAHRRQTADLPPGNYLFVRSSGDEAAATLSFLQFITWLGIKISQGLEWLIRCLIGPALSGRWWSFIYLFALISVVSQFLTWWISFPSSEFS